MKRNKIIKIILPVIALLTFLASSSYAGNYSNHKDIVDTAVSAGTLEKLLKDTKKLKAILTFHVVPGKVMASDVVKLSSVKTVHGNTIKISTKNGVKVENAKVIATDVKVPNGVIHIIDSVILPN